VPIAEAGTWVTAFWAGLMVGRFLFGFVAERAPLAMLLRLSLAAIALGALLLALDAGAFASAIGLVVCGLAMAPIFPSLIATTPARVGLRQTANTVGMQIAGATLGASLVPAATGVIVGRLGLEVVAPVVFCGTLVLALLHELLARLREAPAAQPIG
jgi:fucose permease